MSQHVSLQGNSRQKDTSLTPEPNHLTTIRHMVSVIAKKFKKNMFLTNTADLNTIDDDTS